MNGSSIRSNLASRSSVALCCFSCLTDELRVNHINNEFQATEVVLHLEPWGDQLLMAPASTLSLMAKAERAGSFEIEHLESAIIVWAWPTSTVKVFDAGVEVGTGVSRGY